jgi:hypothetical protein
MEDRPPSPCCKVDLLEPQESTDREPEREVERRDGRTDPYRPSPLTHSEITIKPFDRRYFELYTGAQPVVSCSLPACLPILDALHRRCSSNGPPALRFARL